MYFPKIKEASDNVDPSIKRAMIFATLVVIVIASYGLSYFGWSKFPLESSVAGLLLSCVSIFGGSQFMYSLFKLIGKLFKIDVL